MKSQLQVLQRIAKDIQLALVLKEQNRRYDFNAVKNNIQQSIDNLQNLNYNTQWKEIHRQCKDLELDTTQLEIELSFAQADAV